MYNNGLIKSLVKYITEGLAIAIAVFLIPTNKLSIGEVLIIAFTAGSMFAILDTYSPKIGDSVRQGTGIGIGIQQIGLGTYGVEEFNVKYPSNVCTNMNGSCGYTSVASDDDKEKYLCHIENNICSPVEACINNGTECELNSKYADNQTLNKRRCLIKSNECRMVEEYSAEPFNDFYV